MQSMSKDLQSLTVNTNEKKSYEIPAIIYEGIITTRAGTGGPVGETTGAVDPADLFGDD